MKCKTKNIKFWFFLTFLGTILFLPQTSLAAVTDDIKNTYNAGSSVNELQQMAGKPTNRIKIPGIEYSDIKQVKEGDKTYLYIPFIGEYLSIIYRYLVVLAGLVAVIMIIIGGIQWTASGGNSSSIDSAKNKIIGAVTGLGLALGSYVILYTINPELVNFRSLKIFYVEGQAIEGDHSDISELGLTPADFTVDPNRPAPNCPEVAKNIRENISTRELYKYTKDAEKCRQACVAALPADKKSHSSGAASNESYLGYVDCSSIKGTRTLESIKYIGIHEGKVTGGPSWWWLQYLAKGSGSAFGTHYFVSRTGVVSQLVDEKYVVWHGVSNGNSIGIDLDAGCSSAEGSDAVSKTCSYTAEQYASLKTLIENIQTRTSVEFDDEHVLGHCQASTNPKTGHIDPRQFDWTQIGLNNEKHKGVRCVYAL